ncbi:MAG: helix-turn-helix transcriptional regulator [Epsilonproteobacteria bacterium]|nr:helix-turn-helix transcriptional regulator [Campylobacterota bacterium]
MLSFISKTSDDILLIIRDNFKARRLEIGYTQDALSKRSGVSLGSLKRFESTGQISLESLLKIALILDALHEFESICSKPLKQPQTLDEILLEEKKPKRGRKA